MPSMHHGAGAESGATSMPIRSVSVAIITGAGKAFSGGGDLDLVKEMSENFEVLTRVWKEARDLVYNIINCSKPIVSRRCRGRRSAPAWSPAFWRISRSRRKAARIIDGHTRLGVAAGDHAAIVWPLLCGLAKSKYHLLLCEALSGEEAERIGLVSLCVEDDQLTGQGARGRDPVGQRFADRDPLDQIRAEQLAADGGPNLRYLAGAGVHGLLRRGRARGASLATRESVRPTSSRIAALTFFSAERKGFCTVSGRFWHIGPERSHIDTRT